MSASCCIIGKTEKETLEKSLKWISGWATGIVNDLNVVRHSLSRISNGCYGNLHRNYGKSTKKDLCIELDTMNTLIGGIIYQINRAYKDEEDADLLKELAEQFQDINDQMSGKKPILTDPFQLWNNPLAGIIQDLDTNVSVVNIPGNYEYWHYKPNNKVFDELSDIIDNSKIKNKENFVLLFTSLDVAKNMYLLKWDTKESVMELLHKKYPGIKRVFYYTEKIEEFAFKLEDSDVAEKKDEIMASNETIESLVNTKRPPRLHK